MAEVAVGALGSVAGSLTAEKLGGGSSNKIDMSGYYSTPNFIYQMNDMLQNGLDKAMQYETNYTNQGINQQNQSLSNANQAIQTGLNNANQQAQNISDKGLQQYQTLNAPYTSAGYNALDSYMDSLGLSRPQVGSQAIVSATQQANNIKSKLAALGAAPSNPGLFNQQAPSQVDLSQLTPQQVQQYINQNTTVNPTSGLSYYTGYNGAAQGSGPGTWNAADVLNNKALSQGSLPSVSANNPIYINAAQGLQQQLFNQAQQQYSTNLNNYNQQVQGYNNYQQQAGQIASQISPEQLQLAKTYTGLFN